MSASRSHARIPLLSWERPGIFRQEEVCAWFSTRISGSCWRRCLTSPKTSHTKRPARFDMLLFWRLRERTIEIDGTSRSLRRSPASRSIDSVRMVCSYHLDTLVPDSIHPTCKPQAMSHRWSNIMVTPTRTLFQNSKTWLMDDKRDPLDGWPIWDVLHRSSPAKEDRYGKSYVYIRDVLRLFLDRLATANVSFELYCLDARELKNSLGWNKYARIEVRLSTQANKSRHPTSPRSPTYPTTATLDVARRSLAFRPYFSRLSVIHMLPSSLFSLTQSWKWSR
jgi:hypothetical protein